ncbi:23S rRNA (pseudouridine(1915)-N(3))-methyltransferase RlmH [Candidatus Woesearchaeota archaeon]|nr:23S rRNA (pseudouridine(1915)-N(3))-methyltransferase RlmH [Candidatus Woesearchaeota archaeon]
MRVRIVALGKPTKEYRALISEYEKRLPKYCNFEAIEYSENVKSDKIKTIGRTVALDLRGEQMSSEVLAEFVKNKDALTFIIGGPEGLPALKVQDRIGFGKITLPHQLARLVLTEQLYRAFTIIKKEKYHK